MTYIYAEGTKDFGFNVTWDEKSRTLSLESPYYAGYVYSKLLYNGEAQTEQAKGNFSVLYNKDGLTGTGDAKYSSIVFSSSDTEYCFSLGYYQNEGLFFASSLFDVLEPLTSGGNAYPIFEPEKKYDLVNQNIVFRVNGITAKEVAIARYGGNGHNTYYIYAYDLPKFAEDEIFEVYLSIGKQKDNLQSFSMEVPQKNVSAAFFEKIKKHPFDVLHSSFSLSDNYTIVCCDEVTTIGNYLSKMYVVNNKTLEISDELLKKVRQFEGYNQSRLYPFGFVSGKDLALYGISEELFDKIIIFGCMSRKVQNVFSIDLEAFTVNKLW